MPPKPWQTRKKPVQNISQIIQSNPTVKQQIPKLPPTQINPTTNINNNSATNTIANSTNNLASTSLANSSYGGYGSGLGSYGGYGSSYGGYGSGYSGLGGYGGYGGGYSSYGMGGMYGMGRYGLMGGQEQQKGVLFNTLITLDSFSYLINCLCEIARSMDQNYQGLSLFYKSFKNLIARVENGFIGGIKWIFNKIKNFFVGIFKFIVENIFFMGQTNLKSKYRAIKFILALSIIVLSVSFYPLIRKGIKNV